ncbi:hypothetical protein H5410_013333 [Solanum commersonii]|uniref:Uncharacterized protein n=1 Tax=Solanum commersonii TaxID=4109 RepID=A0A9J6AV25_SOLCO|nr:hypothetical protein H5410_013333 [Solanum commersonii]
MFCKVCLIYLLSFITPPKCIIYDIHRVFAKFLWNFKRKEEQSTICDTLVEFQDQKVFMVFFPMDLVLQKTYHKLLNGRVDLKYRS